MARRTKSPGPPRSGRQMPSSMPTGTQPGAQASTKPDDLHKIGYVAIAVYVLLAIACFDLTMTMTAWYFTMFCLIKKPINWMVNKINQLLSIANKVGDFWMQGVVVIIMIIFTMSLIGHQAFYELAFWYLFCINAEKVIAVLYFLMLVENKLTTDELFNLIFNTPKKDINVLGVEYNVGTKDLLKKQFEKGASLIDLSRSYYVIPVFCTISMHYALLNTIYGKSMLDGVSIEQRINYTLTMISFFIVHIISLFF